MSECVPVYINMSVCMPVYRDRDRQVKTRIMEVPYDTTSFLSLIIFYLQHNIIETLI